LKTSELIRVAMTEREIRIQPGWPDGFVNIPTMRDFGKDDEEVLSRRVSFRVSLRWKNRKNGRERLKTI